MTPLRVLALVGVVVVIGLLARLYWLVRRDDQAIEEWEREEDRRRRALGSVTMLSAYRRIERGRFSNGRRG